MIKRDNLKELKITIRNNKIVSQEIKGISDIVPVKVNIKEVKKRIYLMLKLITIIHKLIVIRLL